MTQHTPVLLKEVLHYLDPQPNQNFIDCTLGGGGHAQRILERISPRGKLLAIDASFEAIDQFSKMIQSNLDLASRTILVHDNFVNLREIVIKKKFFPVHGILVDLGLSSDLLQESGRGFSFQKDEPLDMRLDPRVQSLKAADILNQWSKERLQDVFFKFGEERLTQPITETIIRWRTKQSFQKTTDLVRSIESALNKKFPVKSLARIFQALRIAVNNELDNLEKIIPIIIDLLTPGGRLAIISFHSLEDRIVKQCFKSCSQIKIINKKVVKPAWPDILRNKKSRSAKLRVIEKI